MNEMAKIFLCRNRIGAEGVKAIGEALKVNTSLNQINLRWNGIGDEGVFRGEALKVNTSLTNIALRGNKIGAEFGQSERH